MKFSLRQLEIFVAVSRTGSVSKAAQALFLSQSAASTALAEFEKQYNVQLFDRVVTQSFIRPFAFLRVPCIFHSFF